MWREMCVNTRWGVQKHTTKLGNRERKRALSQPRKCPKRIISNMDFRSRRLNNCDEDEEIDNDGNFYDNWDYRQYQGVILYVKSIIQKLILHQAH